MRTIVAVVGTVVGIVVPGAGTVALVGIVDPEAGTVALVGIVDPAAGTVAVEAGNYLGSL